MLKRLDLIQLTVALAMLSVSASGGCTNSVGRNVEVVNVNDMTIPFTPIDTIVIKQMSQPHSEFRVKAAELSKPYESTGSFESSIPKKVIQRGKEGLESGAVLGLTMSPSSITTNKGNILVSALALSLMSAGSVVGGSVGLVEGIVDDLTVLKDRMQGIEDGRYSSDEIQTAMKKMKTREILAEHLHRSAEGLAPGSVRILTDNGFASDGTSETTSGSNVLLVNILETDFVQPSEKDSPSFQFHLAIRSEIHRGYGAIMDSRAFHYRSKEGNLQDWAQNKAELFKIEHARACHEIAEEIAQVYLRRAPR